MTKRNYPTQEQIKEILHYDPFTGIFTWTRDIVHNAKKGQKAGWLDNKGYLNITMKNKRYYGHRIAWIYMRGVEPKHQIDHRNLERNDNRWLNLREATGSDNVVNSELRIDNTSGIKGVWWHRKNKKWCLDMAGRYIASFSTLEEAEIERRKLEPILFNPEFLRKY